jgi:hypothetical protein
MADEITKNYVTGLTLYFCRFKASGNVFLTDAATDEVWGTSGDADFYDAPMVEEAAGSGHYKGSFASGGTAIAAGVYGVTIYYQTGANPANSPTDVAIGEGEIYWDGTAEINPYTNESDIALIVAKLPDDYIMGSSVTTSKDDEIDNTLAGIIPLTTTVSVEDSTTSFTITAGIAVADALIGMAIMVKDAGDAHWEERTIVSWSAARVVVVDRAFGFTPTVADVVWIKGSAYGRWNAILRAIGQVHIRDDDTPGGGGGTTGAGIAEGC